MCGRGLNDFATEGVAEYLACQLQALLWEWVNTFEGIVDAEFVVLVSAHDVVGEEFYALDNGVLLDVVGHLLQVGFVVVDTGHDDMANPCGFAYLLKIVHKGGIVAAADACEAWVEFVVGGLDIEHHEVGLENGCTCGIGENDAGSVECSVETSLFAQAEEGFDKGRLHKRFAPCAGDSARLDETLIALYFLQQFFGRHFVLHLSLGVPRVGVVAKLAAHGASLHEGYEADARTVNSAKTFYRVNFSNHDENLLKFRKSSTC